MSNKDFSMMGRARAEAPRKNSNTGLYVVFGGAVLLAALVGGLVVFFLLRAPGQSAAARNGQPAAATAAGPQYATTAKFGDWLVRCRSNNGTTAKPCLVLLQVNQQNRLLFAWIVGLTDKNVVQTVFRTPTGMNVGKGVDIKFGASTRHVGFTSCLPQQCSARAEMDDAFIKDMTGSEKADVILRLADGRDVDITIQLAGFDKALDAIKK